jgi:glucan phosphoethanolaminetransferase (alkaline phosphatase superfamily)
LSKTFTGGSASVLAVVISSFSPVVVSASGAIVDADSFIISFSSAFVSFFFLCSSKSMFPTILTCGFKLSGISVLIVSFSTFFFVSVSVSVSFSFSGNSYPSIATVSFLFSLL